MNRTVRNVLIVFALAAAVYAIPTAGDTASFISSALGVAMLGLLAWFAAKFYLEHRYDIDGLGDNQRAVLYSALAAIVFLLAARTKLLGTGGGTILWFAIAGAAAYGLYAVWRHWRTYA